MNSLQDLMGARNSACGGMLGAQHSKDQQGYWNAYIGQQQDCYSSVVVMGKVAAAPIQPTTRGKTMFQEITNDVKKFVIDNRGVIYFVAAALIIDHVIFKGVFRDRLQGMAEKLVGKIEAQIDK